MGNGPFPGVLLIHGSGAADMNETDYETGYVRIDNETGSKIYPPTRPFFQILNIFQNEVLQGGRILFLPMESVNIKGDSMIPCRIQFRRNNTMCWRHPEGNSLSLIFPTGLF